MSTKPTVPGRPRWGATRLAGVVGVRAALVAGFGLLVVLWLAAVVDLAFKIREANRQLNTMTERFIHTDDTLQAIRTGVLLGAIDWRDAFLDTNANRISVYRSQLRAHQEQSEAHLATLRTAGMSGVGRGALDALAREVNAYWTGVIPLLDMAPLRQATEMRRVLNDRVIPKRALVISIVQQVQQLNRARFQQQQRQTAELHQQAQTRVAATGAVATIMSVVIGWLVFGHVTRLEAQLRAELVANADITADLHRLSARVVRVQEEERRVIARELHDEIGQALTAVKLQLSHVRRACTDRAAAQVDEARTIVDAAVQSTRNLSRLLHPPMLDDIGLSAAVEWYLRGFAERTGIEATFDHQDSGARDAPEIETCLFRVVQEATTNVAKHAEARHCRVYLQRLPSSVVLTIEDDGKGFDVVAHPTRESGGLGLLGIQERVAGFRGILHVDSQAGHGTRITVEIPRSVERGSAEAEPAAVGVGHTDGEGAADGSHSAG